VNALFALKRGRAVSAKSNGLTGAHGNAGLLHAVNTQARIAEDHVIGEAGHGLNFAA
jgi:hypothetical protein